MFKCTKNPVKKSVHSETLFHFCRELKNIKGILSDRAFRPSHTREAVNVNNISTPYYWVPMVSFCDLKVFELELHLQKYGSFGIGLSKNWGIDKGLNPVLYLSQGCLLFGEIREALIKIDEAHQELSTNRHDASTEELYDKILNGSQTILKMYSYTKNYQGDLYRDGKVTENFRFADDKEWRFVPEILPPFCGCSLKNSSVQDWRDEKEELNRNLKENHWLRFEYSDIKFIVVPDELESMSLIKFIEELPVDHETIVSLISKILIVEHLEL